MRSGTIRTVVCAAALMVAPMFVPLVKADAAAPALSADYQFQGKLTGCGGVRALTAYPGTAYATQVVDGKSRKVLTFKTGSGVRLAPTTGIAPNASYTVVALFKLSTISGWRMIMDVKGLGGDDAFYNYSGQVQWYPLAKSAAAPIKANAWVQVAVSVAAKHITGYVNGTQVYSVADPSGYSTISSKNIASFFKDNTGVGSEQSAGAVARLRFYKGPLSAAAIKALDRSPVTACH